jgi:ketosteroid isomerase-like protein
MSPPAAPDRQATTLEVVRHFNEAFGRRDVDAIMALMTDDCAIDSTRPPPDGERFEGQQAVRAYWAEFFRRSPRARFDTEEIFAVGDRCVVRWVYHWVREGTPGHVRGVDIFRIRDGNVAEKLSYVKS